MPSRVSYWRCDSCFEMVEEGAFLRAPSPFDPNDEIIGCPHCKAADEFTNICDYPGCRSAVSNGTPTPDGGYVNRCHVHGPWYLERNTGGCCVCADLASMGLKCALHAPAQGIETRSAADAKRRGPKGESPVLEEDAPRDQR